MNLVRLSLECGPFVIDPNTGKHQEEIHANYFRGINLGYLAAWLSMSDGKSVPGGYCSTSRNIARSYASREAMGSAFPDQYDAHQKPSLFMDELRRIWYNGSSIFPALVVAFNSDSAVLPDWNNDIYQRGSFANTHERIVSDIPLADVEPTTQQFIRDYFELA